MTLTRNAVICTTTWSRTTFATNYGLMSPIWVAGLSLVTLSNVESVRLVVYDALESILMLTQAIPPTEITG
jgi:hypothetical protein